MSMVETIVLNKLQDYKEQGNRERFVLPNNKDISFFIDVIKECISFMS